jgi:hypothetical protein
VVAIALLGAAFGAGVIYVDWPFPPRASAFTSTGPYLLWLSLLSAETALWALALPLVSASLKALWRFGASSWPRVVLSTASLAAAILVVVGASEFVRRVSHSELDYPLPAHATKLIAITAIGNAVALAAGLGMALVEAGGARIARTDLSSEEVRATALADFLLLREHLQRLLAIEGVIIGVAVLATAALRNAVLAYGAEVKAHPHSYPHVPPPSFPPEYVLLYGASVSLVLALFWAPIYTILVSAGTRLVNSAVGERRTGESWTDWQERRAKFEQFLGVEASATANFRSAVAILTPLGSALVGLLFQT